MLQIKKLFGKAQLPILAYNESAAFDLSAYLLNSAEHPITVIIPPNTVKLIGTGLAMRPPDGHLILVCSRSGLAANGIFVANAPGVVDPTYTGEIKVALFNGGTYAHYVKHEDRIAQILVVPYSASPLRLVEDLPQTTRGDRGFGSSGA